MQAQDNDSTNNSLSGKIMAEVLTTVQTYNLNISAISQSENTLKYWKNHENEFPVS